jgi:hypothetical protein
MKNFSIRMYKVIYLLMTLLLTGTNTMQSLAQESVDSTLEEKKKARISLDYFNVNNKEHRLVATVKTRIEGYFISVQGVKINFYKDIFSPENLLDSKVTDDDGRAILTIPQAADTALWYTFIATLENNPEYEDADKETLVKKARMTMTLKEEDSLRIAQIFVGSQDSAGNIVPVEGVAAKVSVKRLFGLMPVTQEVYTTDEEGYINMEFPAGIPGDKNGSLTVFAQVSEHDEFGNLEVSDVVAWGAPTKSDEAQEEYELWLSSSNSPRVLLITVNILVLGIVGVIVYIIRQLIHIKKLGIKEG